jgi:glycosyltransferase involved in cell wall biosynthesis
MRVLLTGTTHFSDMQGGVQRVVLDEATELRELGWDVWVLATGKASQPEHELHEGIHLLRYAPGQVPSWHPSRRTAHQRAAKAVLSRNLPEVDAIHGQAPLSYLAAIDFCGDRAHRAYTVQSPVRDEMAIVWKKSGFARRLISPIGLEMLNKIERQCIQRSTTVTALSRFTVDCIAKIHGHGSAKSVHVTPGWCETSKFAPIDDRARAKASLGWRTDVPVLFTLRRLVPRMGLDRLLQACSLLDRRGIPFHLMIGGSGPLRAELESQSQSLGLAERVTFLGRIDDHILPKAYAACDAFVLPTAELECFGLIALEALAAGRPVLATPVGSIPEILNGFEPQWLAKSASSEDIAELLNAYLQGALPNHSPAKLHEQTHAEYGRQKRLPEFIHRNFGALVSASLSKSPGLLLQHQ